MIPFLGAGNSHEWSGKESPVLENSEEIKKSDVPYRKLPGMLTTKITKTINHLPNPISPETYASEKRKSADSSARCPSGNAGIPRDYAFEKRCLVSAAFSMTYATRGFRTLTWRK